VSNTEPVRKMPSKVCQRESRVWCNHRWVH